MQKIVSRNVSLMNSNIIQLFFTLHMKLFLCNNELTGINTSDTPAHASPEGICPTYAQSDTHSY